MNKNLYILLIIFLGLTTALGIWNFIITIQIGTEIYKADSFIAWFLLLNITGIIGPIFLLKYYLHHNYRVAFFTGTIAVIANVVFVTVWCIASTLKLGAYYKIAVLLDVCASIVYALSLIFSNTRKRFWLKLAGICGLVIVLVSASAFIGSIYSKNVRIISILGKISQWGSIAWGVVNVMFIMNLLGEIRVLKTENVVVPRNKYLENILGFLVTVDVIFIIAIGTLIVNESHTLLVWRDSNAKQAQQLVNLAGGARTFVNSDGDSLHYLLIKPQKYDQ
ncbi:MAG: hypothetical protein ABIS01_09385, partial [Ferruginibacter sp.]